MSDFVSVELRPARDVLISGREETVPFVVSVKGEYSASPPVAFLIVIDTSYSMDGEKIFRAKQAAIEAVSLLREKDLVGIYGFDGKFHKILEPVPAVEKDRIEKAIVSMRLGSGTNMYEVFKRLSEEAKKIIDISNVAGVRIIFITDGEPTKGPKKMEKILEPVFKLRDLGASALVIGVGGEYNEKLLLKIASVLNGVFEHVSNPDKLRKALRDYTMVAREVSAKNVTITFKPMTGVTVNIYNRESYSVPGGLEVELGDISYRETIDVIGEVIIPPFTPGEYNIMEIQVSYINPITGEKEFMPPVKYRARVVTVSEAGAMKLREEVIAEAQLVKTAKRIESKLTRGKGKVTREELEKDLEEMINATMRFGSEGLAATTMSIREKIEEGVTGDVSKEMTSVISKIISGKLKEIKEEEKKVEGSERRKEG
jgi:Ca-activated chloride channel family protein